MSLPRTNFTRRKLIAPESSSKASGALKICSLCLSRRKWNWWTRCWGYVYRGAGVSADDIVFCSFSFGPYLSHWAAISGAWHVGAMCVSGGGMNSGQRLQAILDNRCTVLVCTPTYALHLAEVAKEQGIDLRSSSVRRSIHAGEPGASLPNVKRAIEA